MDTDIFYQEKVIAIIRGLEGDVLDQAAARLVDGGLSLMEVTLDSPDALGSIKRLKRQFGDSLHIGAGTVMNEEEAAQALEAGATFIISPHLDLEVVRKTKELGAISIPGAMTPTEIVTAYKAGADFVKVFPAGTLGARFLKDLKGPLPEIPIIPTGGLNLDNFNEYIDAGAVACGIGSSLVPGDLTADPKDLDELYHRAKQFAGLAGQTNRSR